MAKVFISHRIADRAPATRLAEDLTSRGHAVWLDDWEISVGDSIIGKMNSGLEAATYVVVCYSDAGSLAPWMGREWMAALARQLNGSGVALLPVRLTGGEPPAILADIRYADLVTDWFEGLESLAAAIR